MRQIHQALAASIAFHIILFAVLIWLHLPEHQRGVPPTVELVYFQDLASRPPPPKAASIISAPRRRDTTPPEPSEIELAAVSDLPSEGSSHIAPTHADILTERTDTLRVQAARRWALYHRPLPDSLLAPSDSLLLLARLSIYGGPLADAPTAAGEDLVSSYLYRKNTGHSPLANLSGLVGLALSGLDRIGGNDDTAQRPRIESEPTRLELQLLGTLWAEKTATDMDLYQSLDASVPITAVGLNRILENMTTKGMLKRKKISPEDVLKVVTPLGSFPVERNELNRKNPVYSYTAVISKDEVLQYLNAQLFLSRQNGHDKSPEADTTSSYERRLASKTSQLLGRP